MKSSQLKNAAVGLNVMIGCAFCVAMVSTAAIAEDIIIRREAVPKSAVVRLGDLAEIRGSDPIRVERLARLPLMPAPAAGALRFVRAREIADMLDAHGEDLKQLRFAGESQVAVQPPQAANNLRNTNDTQPTKEASAPNSRAADSHEARRAALTQGRVTGVSVDIATDVAASQINETVQKAILDYLAAQTGTSSGWQVKFNLSEIQRTKLAATKSPITCEGGNAPWGGKQQFAISFASAGQPAKLFVAAEVALSQPIVVAVRAIPRGAIVTAADVELQQSDKSTTASGRKAPIGSIEELIGMEAGRAIQVGEVVLSEHIRKPTLVKRGEAITVVAQGGGIRVRTTARAIQDGGQGDLVMVESLDSKEKFDARVTGLREVAVLAPAGNTNELTAARKIPEQTPFRRFASADSTPRDGVPRAATAFRKFQKSDGTQHAEIR